MLDEPKNFIILYSSIVEKKKKVTLLVLPDFKVLAVI